MLCFAVPPVEETLLRLPLVLTVGRMVLIAFIQPSHPLPHLMVASQHPHHQSLLQQMHPKNPYGSSSFKPSGVFSCWYFKHQTFLQRVFPAPDATLTFLLHHHATASATNNATITQMLRNANASQIQQARKLQATLVRA